MSNVSTQVIQSMFNHLTASYSADEAKEILAQKYPDAAGDIQTLVVDPTKYGVTTVEMGKVVSRTEANEAPAGDLLTAVKAKTKKAAKPKAEKAAKSESKADIARKLYAESADKSRAAMIALFQEKLGMSKAAASTYYYNVKG